MKYLSLLAIVSLFSINLLADMGPAGGGHKKSGCLEYEPNWTLIDNYNFPAGDGNPTTTYPLGMYVSKKPAGKVYVSAASIYQNGPVREVKGFIRRSVNFGGSFSTSNFVYNTEGGSLGIRIIQAPNNKVLYFSENHVFASQDLANNFSEIANISQQISGYDNIVLASAVVAGNAIYAVANGKSTINGYYNWRGLLLKSNDNGVTWSLKKAFSITDPYITWLTSVDVDSSGRVYVGGYSKNASDYYWLVQKSNSSVTSWTALETQMSPVPNLSYVRALKVTADDKLVAAGGVTTLSGLVTFVRRYNGNTASTVFQSQPGLQGTDLYVAEGGNIFMPYTINGVAGMARSTNNGLSFNANWSTIDFGLYSYEMGEDSKNSLYVTTQDNTNLKIYKRLCIKDCGH